MSGDARAALDWSDTDARTVDLIRVLAMDAVERAGSGHPGTAMSLAPAAYLLYQKVMRHDPADPLWPGRDRFVLSCGHSSLTLYIQLYLSGYGLTLDDLEHYRVWGSKTPGHPEHHLTRRRGDDDRPARPGHRERGRHGHGGAPRARPARSRRRARHEPVRPLRLLLRVRRRHGGRHQPRGGLPRRAPAARQPDRAVRRQQHLHRGRHQHRQVRGRGRPVRGVRLARAAAELGTGGGLPRERAGAVRRVPRRRRATTTAPSFISLRTIIAWPAPHKQNTGAAHGAALGADEVAATKKILGFDPAVSFPAEDELVDARAQRRPTAASRRTPPGTSSSPRGRRRTRSSASCSTG